MKQYTVKFNSVSDVKYFVDVSTQFPCDIAVEVGTYLINGKSIMVLFSVELNETAAVSFFGDTQQALQFEEMLSNKIALTVSRPSDY